ncbi:MAG TPA: hypothetical protein VND41_00465 [Nitrososphaerales archaeon]|nr:hypothetical protein [Nitrososphaerales archaeon]
MTRPRASAPKRVIIILQTVRPPLRQGLHLLCPLSATTAGAFGLRAAGFMPHSGGGL